MPDTQPTPTAAEVLTAHQRQGSHDCLCGPLRLGSSYAQHQADMLAAAGLLVTPEHDMQVAARALREAADGADSVGHLWSGAVAHGFFALAEQYRARADRIATGEES